MMMMMMMMMMVMKYVCRAAGPRVWSNQSTDVTQMDLSSSRFAVLE